MCLSVHLPITLIQNRVLINFSFTLPAVPDLTFVPPSAYQSTNIIIFFQEKPPVFRDAGDSDSKGQQPSNTNPSSPWSAFFTYRARFLDSKIVEAGMIDQPML